MKKILSLLLVIVLVGCGGGSSPSNPGPVNPGDPNVPGIDDELTAAEQLFGQGNGTDANPTELLTRLDNTNAEYVSFGAWGNVYDLIPTQAGATIVGPLGVKQYRWYHYDFTPQQNAEMAGWTTPVDTSLANATFKGPAIMNAFDNTIPEGYEPHLLPGDYGSMEVKFGMDVNSPIINFVMNNPDNNISLYGTTSAGSIVGLSNDKNNIHVQYERDIPSRVYIDEPGYYTYEAPQHLIYKGYGTKQ